MNISINIKGVSNRQNKIVKLVYSYPEYEMTLRDFLSETVKISVKAYNDNMKAGEVLKTLTRENIENQAETGKVPFGIINNENKADEQTAIDNVLQCFKDGMIAVFIDNKRYEELDTKVAINEGSEVTFIRLTFLAGRMW